MYILLCADGSYYTGSTWNLEQRLWQHQNGEGANHTRKHLPVKLVYCETCERISDAFAREKQVQGWSRKKKEALMANDANELHRLAGCLNGTSHVGFGFAQPTGSAQPPAPTRSLSGVEGSEAEGSNVEGSNVEGRQVLEASASAPLSQRNPRSLSGVEGSGVEGSGVEGSGAEGGDEG
jgi:putative endonuclease